MAHRWKPRLKFFSSKPPGTEGVPISQRTPTMVESLKPILKFISSNCVYLLPSKTPQVLQEPPSEFRCPIHNSLMYEPVTVSPGLTFERACIEACRELNYIPFSSFELTPDEDLKSKILHWCNQVGHPHPHPISQEEARNYARKCMALQILLQTVFTKPADDQESPLIAAETRSSSADITARIGFDPLKVIKKILMKLEIKKISSRDTTPSSKSSSSSSSYFSKAIETLSRMSTTAASASDSTTTSIDSDSMEKEILEKLKSEKSSIREEALITLYECARQSRDWRIALCSHSILATLIPKLHPRHPPTQIIKATAAITSLSEEPSIRFKIAQSGAISRLVSLLKNRDVEARDLSAHALKNLALEESNKEFIGSSIDAVSALVDHFCEPSGNYLGRKYAGMALFHLILNCPDNLTRLAKTSGAVQKLLKLTMDKSSDETMNLGGFAMVLIWKLSWTSEAREALIEAGVVGEMVRMMREREGEEEYCLAMMYQTCDHNVALFKGLAISAGAEEVLSQDKEGWGEMGRGMARRMLAAIREDDRESVKQLASDVFTC